MKSFLETDTGKKILDVGKHFISYSKDEQYTAIQQFARVNTFSHIGNTEQVQTETKQWVNAAMAATHALAKNNIFRFSEDFAFELQKVNLNIEFNNILWPEAPVLLELPKNLLFSDGVSIAAVCLYKSTSSFDINLFTETERSAIFCVPFSVIQETKSFSKLKENMISAKKSNFLSNPTEAVALIEFILNALLYLQSGNPDLRDYRPVPRSKLFKGSDRAWRRAHPNMSTIPATLVGYGYKKENLVHTDEWTVRGHFRWQPYGPAMSQIKLIWIKAHSKSWSAKDENEV